MTSILLGSLAAEISSDPDVVDLFLDATLTRDVPGTITDPADPPVPTQATYTCKAIDVRFSVGLMAQGLVAGGDIKVLILANSLATAPLPLDRITIRGTTATVVPANSAGMGAVTRDPAGATWSCRCTV